MLTRLVGIGISILFLMVGTQGIAHALSCGNTVTGTETLTADLFCPESHGLFVGDGATLDCAGHTILGADEAGFWGIHLNGVSDATVRNCTVEHFQVGIRLRTATNCTVQDNITQHNTQYGIQVTLSSTGALIQGNTVFNNSDEGIHLSGPTDGDASHHLIGNTVVSNATAGIYVLNSNANTIAGNTIHDQGGSGIFVTGSDSNTIENNTLTNDPILLVSGSQLNVLTGNMITRQRIKFDNAPNNTVVNLNVQGQEGVPANAYHFNLSPDNTIVDSSAADPGTYHIRAANGSTNIVFTRFSATPSLQCFVDKKSSVTVTDPNGVPLACGDSNGGDGGGGGGGGSSREKKCKDGKDNDGDGLTDCADPDCAGKRWCS